MSEGVGSSVDGRLGAGFPPVVAEIEMHAVRAMLATVQKSRYSRTDFRSPWDSHWAAC
jgi:hypothetical protein